VAVFNNVSFRQEQGAVVPEHVVAARIATAKGVAIKVGNPIVWLSQP